MLNHRMSQGLYTEMARRRREEVDRAQLLSQARAQRAEAEAAPTVSMAHGLAQSAAELMKRRRRASSGPAVRPEGGPSASVTDLS